MATSTNTVVYVSGTDGGEITVFGFDPDTGAVEDRGRVAAGAQVMPMAFSPDRRFLHVALRDTQPQLVSYRIDPASGALAEIARMDFPDSLPYLSVDKTGRFLLCASFQQATVRVHPIDRRGAILAEPVMVEHDFPTAHCIQTDPANQSVLVPVRDSDIILQRRFDPVTGRLSPNQPPAFRLPEDTGPRHLAFHPNNRFAYVTGERNGTVVAMDYDITTGRLQLIHAASLLPEGFSGHPKASDLDISPNGRFLYVGERGTNEINAFAIHPTSGRLTLVGRFPSEDLPRSLKISPRGTHLFCAGQGSSSMTVHAINRETGELSDVSRHPVGAGPCWLEVVDLP